MPASTADSLAQNLVDGMLEFARERPAYPLMLGYATQTPRTPAARQLLKAVIAGSLRKMDGLLTPEVALLHAGIEAEADRDALLLRTRKGAG